MYRSVVRVVFKKKLGLFRTEFMSESETIIK
jgi:hypothetical protein